MDLKKLLSTAAFVVLLYLGYSIMRTDTQPITHGRAPTVHFNGVVLRNEDWTRCSTDDECTVDATPNCNVKFAVNKTYAKSALDYSVEIDTCTQPMDSDPVARCIVKLCSLQMK